MSWTMAEAQRRDWKNRAREIAPNERDGSDVSDCLNREIVAPAPFRRAILACESYVYLPVTPCPAPRMSQRDKFNPRPCVIRYRAFCDSVRDEWPAGLPYPEAGAHIVFHVPMPKSWSKKRRAEMDGQPHRGRKDGARAVDKDNMEKALQDALCEDDSHVWHSTTEKRWATAGYIEIFLPS